MKKINLITIIVFFLFLPLIHYAEWSMPEIKFETELTLTTMISDLQVSSAIRIMNGLFYIAICLGVINVVRHFVFYPDKAKKVTINFMIGILAYSILSNFLGLVSQ